MRIRRLLGAVALSLGVLAPMLPAPSQAATGPSCTPLKEHRQRVHTLALYGNLYFNACSRPHAGHAIKWVKPVSLVATYRVHHILLHPAYWCPPANTFQRAVFRVYIWNNETGYNARGTMPLPCDGDGSNSDARGLSYMPRCYTPWIDTSGRVPGGHRAQCRFRITTELVYAGPDHNDHYTVGSGPVAP